MANAYSLNNNYDADIFSPNINLINQVLQTKQTKLDNNRLRVEQALSQVENLDLIRGVDKEYAANRLQKVNEIVDRYANLDLSSNNLTRSLTGDIAQVVDDKVKNALVSTKIYRAEQDKWAKFSEKNPDKYLDRNKAYSMRAANAWLQSDQLDKSYNGGAGIIQASDYRSKLAEALPKALKDVGFTTEIDDFGQTVYRDKGKGGPLTLQEATVKYREITKNKVGDLAKTLLSQQDYQQMQIDAWDSFGRGTQEDLVREQYVQSKKKNKNYYSKLIKDTQEYIETNNLTEDQERPLKERIKAFKSAINNQDNAITNSLQKSNDALSFELYSQDYLDNVSNAYKVEKTMVERKIEDNKAAIMSYRHILDLNKEEFKASLKNQGSTKGNVEVKGKEFGGNPVELEPSDLPTYESAVNSGKTVTTPDGNYTITPSGLKLKVNKNAGIISTGNEDDKLSKEDAFNKKVFDLYEGDISDFFQGEPLTGEVLVKLVNYDYGGTIKVGGEVKEVTPALEEKIFKLKNHASQLKEEFNMIYSSSNKGAEKIQESIIESTDVDINNLDDFRVTLVQGEDGEFKAVSSAINQFEAKDDYSLLLSKAKSNRDSLTPSEEETLLLKSKLHYAKAMFDSSRFSEKQVNSYLRSISDKYDPERSILPTDVAGLKSYDGDFRYDKPRFGDKDFLALGRGDLEKPGKSFFKDENTLLDKDGNGIGVLDYLKNQKTSLKADFENLFSDNIKQNSSDSFTLNNASQVLGDNNLDFISRIQLKSKSELNNLKIVDKESLTFSKIPGTNEYAVKGKFQYTTPKKNKDGEITGESKITLNSTFNPEDADKKDEGRAYIKISENDLNNITSFKVSEGGYNQYSMKQRGMNAESFTPRAPKIISTFGYNNGLNVTQVEGVEPAFNDKVKQAYETLKTNELLKGVRLPELQEQDLLNVIKKAPISVTYTPSKEGYTQIIHSELVNRKQVLPISELSYETIKGFNKDNEDLMAMSYATAMYNLYMVQLEEANKSK